MSDTTWAVVALAFVSGLFAWLNKRDSLRHDTEIGALKSKQAQCEAESKECNEKHAVAQRLLEATRRELAAHDERDKADLQAQITALKAQVAAKKDRIDGNFSP